MRSPLATFLVAAPDQPGLVARLAGFFYGAGLNIVDAKNHTDPDAEGGPRFFMRLVVDLRDDVRLRGSGELRGGGARGGGDARDAAGRRGGSPGVKEAATLPDPTGAARA